MPRDFRPKGKAASARRRSDPPTRPQNKGESDDEDVAEDVLRQGIEALGGTEDDIALIQGKGKAGPTLTVCDHVY
ncbi:hypothetical protein ACI68E_001054 [Malassezia pachydermatis]